MRKKNNWGFDEGAIVERLEQLKSHVKKFSHVERWIVKRPHSFSGIGHFQFDASTLDEKIISKVLSEKVLLEPVYERVFDIGTTFVIEDGK